MVARRNQFTLTICLLTPIALAGCVSTGDGYVNMIEPSKSFTKTVELRLIPYDAARIDIFKSINFDHLIVTGPYWTRVFSDNNEINETFTVVSARMEATGFPNIKYTYYIEGELRCEGKIRPIKVQGSHTSTWARENAMRQAIQKSIINAADSAAQLVKSCSAAGIPTGHEKFSGNST